MNKLPASALAAAMLLTAALTNATAQLTQTDEVLVVNFQLTAVSQGNTTTGKNVVATDVNVNSITSRDVIQAIGASQGRTYSRRARLELLTPTNNLENWTWRIEDGTVTVDVTGFFAHQQVSGAVAASVVNTKNGNFNDTTYSLDSFTLQDAWGYSPLSLHLNLIGFTVLSSRGFANRHGLLAGQLDLLSADVSGTGDFNGAGMVVHGSVSAESIGTTVVPIPGGGGV